MSISPVLVLSIEFCWLVDSNNIPEFLYFEFAINGDAAFSMLVAAYKSFLKSMSSMFGLAECRRCVPLNSFFVSILGREPVELLSFESIFLL